MNVFLGGLPGGRIVKLSDSPGRLIFCELPVCWIDNNPMIVAAVLAVSFNNAAISCCMIVKGKSEQDFFTELEVSNLG